MTTMKGKPTRLEKTRNQPRISVAETDPRLLRLLTDFERMGATLGGGKKGFGEKALQIRGKIFAMIAGDALVLKLPKDRVATLVAEGKGLPFTLGKRTMSEWFVVEKGSRSTKALAKEAFEYVAG